MSTSDLQFWLIVWLLSGAIFGFLLGRFGPTRREAAPTLTDAAVAWVKAREAHAAAPHGSVDERVAASRLESKLWVAEDELVNAVRTARKVQGAHAGTDDNRIGIPIKRGPYVLHSDGTYRDPSCPDDWRLSVDLIHLLCKAGWVPPWRGDDNAGIPTGVET